MSLFTRYGRDDFGLLYDGVGRIERRDSCLASCDPTQDIHLTWIGEGASRLVVYNFKERVRTQVFVVVDVRLDPDALLSVDGLLVVFVECELNVGFAELHLFEAAGCACMEECGADFWSECSLGGGAADLLDEGGVGPREEAILRHLVPNQLFDVVERRVDGQVDLAHRSGEIEKACQRGCMVFQQLFVPILGFLVGGCTSCEELSWQPGPFGLGYPILPG